MNESKPMAARRLRGVWVWNVAILPPSLPPNESARQVPFQMQFIAPRADDAVRMAELECSRRATMNESSYVPEYWAGCRVVEISWERQAYGYEHEHSGCGPLGG